MSTALLRCLFNKESKMTNVLEYLEHSASLMPDKTAVADREHKYSFKELKDTAMLLAGAPALKNAPKGAVGVIVERNADVIMYFMAVLYSGHYYIPLDPEMPAKKLNMIADNAEISVIIGNESQRSIADQIERDICYVTLSDQSGAAPCSDGLNCGPDDPLFMIYTSGSTGVPKGVLKSHRAVMSFIDAYADEFGFDENEVIGNQTPFFFDASAKDIYLMLKTGAAMEILPTEYFAMPPSLIRYMNEREVTFISWVPSALSVIVQLNTFKAVLPTTLKKVFFVGEVMPMKHLNKWREALPDLTYVNLYGSTEIAGISCFYRVDREFENDENLPMGKPLSNCRVYLLDGDKVVTEKDHIGEMYVVSDAVALCYWKDPEKTDSCFVMKDFGEGPVRAYKSGDLARYDENGDLVFVSRSDFQIKHMGHRIELGEIETVAGSLDDIQRCACLYNDKKSRIVLFCQLVPGSELAGNDIKAALTEKLSSYMVPNSVNIMDSLPYNANNKIDRVKLKELL